MSVSDTCSFVRMPVFSRLLGQGKMRSGVDLWGGSERWQFVDL